MNSWPPEMETDCRCSWMFCLFFMCLIRELTRSVTYVDNESSFGAFVFVAARAPVLPFSCLSAGTFLPHGVGVIKAL